MLLLRRLQSPNEPLPAAEGGVYLRLGSEPLAPFVMEPSQRDTLFAFAARGGRVVVAFAPVSGGPGWLQDCEPEEEKSVETKVTVACPQDFRFTW